MLVGLSFGPPAMWQLFAIVFIGYINPHYCKKEANYTQDQWSPKLTDDFGNEIYSPCTKYRVPGDTTSGEAYCSKWTYVDDGFDSNKGTIASSVRQIQIRKSNLTIK